MNLEIVPYKPEHLEGLELAAGVAGVQPLIADPDYRNGLNRPGLSYTVLVDGVPLGSAGLILEEAHRARAWALPGKSLPMRAWPIITRAAWAFFDRAHALGVHRIEIVTRESNAQACRWAIRLGFANPKVLDGWFPNRESAVLWRRLAA